MFQAIGVGITWIAGACNSNLFYRTMVVEYLENDLTTSQVIIYQEF